MRFDKEKSQMAYDLWNSTGRRSIGEKDEILVNDKRTFPKYDEVEINFEIHDGFAVGNFQGREYLMLYPTMEDVQNNGEWLEQVQDYVGFDMVDETGLQPYDIALTFGKIVSSRLLPLNLDTYDSVIRLDANVPVEKALAVINNEVRKDIRNFYHQDIPEVSELPEKENGKIEKGYLILRTNKEAEYVSQPKTPAEIAALENEALENATFESLSQVIEIADMRKQRERVSDVQFTEGENSIYSITCKIDGKQMPVKQLTNRESLRVHQNIIREMDPMLVFTYPMLMQRFAKEIRQNERQNQMDNIQKTTTYQDFSKFIKKKFPEGLTLQLSGMDFYTFMDISELSTELNDFQPNEMDKHLTMPFWYGRIADETNRTENIEKLTLHTTVHVTPDQYDFLLPKIIYRTDQSPSEMMDNAANTQLKKFDGNFSRMEFQIPQSLDFRQAMQIENMPFRQALQKKYDHHCGDIKTLAECIALSKFIQKGSKASVVPTRANQDVIDTLNRYLIDKGEPGEQDYENALRLESHMQMRERGFYPHEKYNIMFKCKSTDRLAEDNAIQVTEELNRNFPFVSAICESNKVLVSLNTTIPIQHAAVERFIMRQPSRSSTMHIKPFDDQRDTKRLIYLLYNGQTIDAYAYRPGNGKKNHYAMEGKEGNVYMRNLNEGENPLSVNVIATDDKLNKEKVQVFDCYKMNEDYCRITDSSLYRKQGTAGANTQWMVRCKVDGIQEMGRSVPPKLNFIINQATEQGTKAPDNRTWSLLKHYTAMQQYKDVLQSNELHQTQGLKR